MRVHVATTGREPGNWLIAIEEGICRVLLGSVTTPDARLFTSSETGHEVLRGSIPILDALRRRLVHWDGEPEAFFRFVTCFQMESAQ
jgi:hypothetical protein